MSLTSPVLASYPITIEEDTDFPALTFTWYPNGTNAAPFDWTGWSSQMQIRLSSSSSVIIATIATALGGTSGTVTIPDIAATQATSIVSALNYTATGAYDILCTRSVDGFNLRFVGASPVIPVRCVTR